MADKSKSTNMGTGRFPRAYFNNVKRDNDTSFIVYQGTVSAERQLEVGNIGYAPSGLPGQASTWPDQIVHVENRNTGGQEHGPTSTGPRPILKGK
jgi:hypothetical protein